MCVCVSRSVKIKTSQKLGGSAEMQKEKYECRGALGCQEEGKKILVDAGGCDERERVAECVKNAFRTSFVVSSRSIAAA